MFAVLLSPQFILLYIFGACATVVHLRGRERLRLGRQILDHSTLLAPYNVLMYLFSAVPNRPILRASDFPELKALRDNWRTIRDEALVLYSDGHIRTAARHNDWGFHSFFRSGWSRFYLKWYEDFLPSARDLCPKTVSLLDSIPFVHGAMFAMLPANARLGPHRDPFAGSLRYHLGLVTPNSDQCCIYVDGQSCTWRDGEDFVFDETYIHRAENLTDQKRIILFCDVERPLKSAFITRLNRWISNKLVKATATQNFDGERVGVINKLFGGAYEIHLVGQRIKKRNRSAYYALKYSAIVVIMAILVVSAFYLFPLRRSPSAQSSALP